MSTIIIQNGTGVSSLKRRSLATASSAALLMLGASAAMAQQPADSTETVVVSSTRIMNADFESPTPTTAISALDVEKQAAPNVFTTITQLPSLMGSTGSTVGNGGSSNGVNGLSTLNLRGVGTQRNLIMMDGERVIPSSSIGISDISQFPQLLIQRVDVVTGGASAAWGSDAVTGVVNFIIDKHFEGFKLNLQGAATTYADDGTALAQFAAGTSFLGGRGHIEVSGEYDSEAGVNSVIGPRTWYKNPQALQYTFSQCSAGCPGGAPQFTNVLNGKFSLFSYGGMITRGPLQGTAFGQNGTPYQFNYGSGISATTGQLVPATPVRTAVGSASGAAGSAGANGGSNTITGCLGGYCVGGDTTGNQTGYGSLVARLERANFYTRVSYDLTPKIEIYATAMWSEVFTWDKPTQSFFKSDNLEIGCDNPYLPTGIAAACTSNATGVAATTTTAGTPNFGVYAPTAVDVANGPGGGTLLLAGNPQCLASSPNTPVAGCFVNGFANGFTAGKMQYGVQNSVLTNVENYNDRNMRRVVIGADGEFDAFGTDWNFKGYYQHGENRYHNELENILVTPFYNAAIDAVQVTTANQSAFPQVPVGNSTFTTAYLGSLPLTPVGSIICRSAVARSAGCEPLNIIGTGNVNTAGQQFVQGTGNVATSASGLYRRDPFQTVTNRQEVMDFVVSGEPIEDWAGKVSVATGFQYREEAFHTITDCASQGNCANQTWGGVAWGPAGDPLLTPGLNGLPPLFPNWYAGNFQPVTGHAGQLSNFHEQEMFLEANVPLINDAEFGKANLDLAGRETVYTTSGWVSTWKVGLTWDTPIDGLRLRALQSRDVRAPNLAELYAGARVNNGSVTDHVAGSPFNNATISPLPNPITANPNLKPERGATTEMGMVYSPDWLPGLDTSITYYRIGVKGEITSLSQQQEMDLCAQQANAAQCALISTGGQPWAVNGVINTTLLNTSPNLQVTPNINLASVVTDGIDYEVSYHFAMDDALNWGLGGDVTLRMLATNVMKFQTNPGLPGAIITEAAGANSGNIPHWKIFFTQAYDQDKWGIFVNERWFSDGQINRLWVTCTTSPCAAPVDANHPTVNTNFEPGELYFDVGGRYNLSESTQMYFKIDNLTNQNPGNAYSYGQNNQGAPLNPALYDVLGRFYHVGVRISE